MQPEIDSFRTLVNIVERLRATDGCPWDKEQTHESLKRTLVEECYEVLEAIDSKDAAKLSEELGDILIQVAFHCQMAGEFSVEDVLAKANQKLIRRHPHVFGDVVVRDARDVERNWEKLKEQEGPKKLPVEGIPKELPALAYAQLMQDRVSRVGFEWDDVSGVLDKLMEEVDELKTASDKDERAWEMGDVLFTMVNLSRWLGIHAEEALRQANARFQSRYAKMENLATERGLRFPELPLDEMEKLWQEAKGLAG